jgi:signal transduction histidine kinase
VHPWFLVKEAQGRDGGAAGLGLAIIRHAAQVHGREVPAWSHPEGGLVVALILPAL